MSKKNKSENMGLFLAGFAKDIINNKIHGYGDKNKTQDYVSKKIKEFNETLMEESKHHVNKEKVKRKKEVEDATELVLSKFEKTFNNLLKKTQRDKFFKLVKDYNLNYFEGAAIIAIITSSSCKKEDKILSLKEAILLLEERIDMVNKT